MNDRNRNLDSLLAKARVRPRLVPEQDVRSLLQAAAPGSDTPAVAGDRIAGAWKAAPIAGLAAALLVASVSFVVWRGSNVDRVDSSVAPVRVNHAAVERPAVALPRIATDSEEPAVQPQEQTATPAAVRHISKSNAPAIPVIAASIQQSNRVATPEESVLGSRDTSRRILNEEHRIFRGSPGIRMIELTDDELHAIGLEIIPDGEAALGFRLYKIDPNAASPALPPDSALNRAATDGQGSGRLTVREELVPGRQIDINRRLPLQNGLRIITDNAGKEISRDNSRGDDGFAAGIDDLQLRARTQRRTVSEELEQDGGWKSYRSLLRDGTLLPIRVPLGRRDSAAAMAPPPTHVVFWCRLTPDLFSSLPVRFRRVVLQELTQSARPREGEQEPVLETLQRAWAARTLGELRDRAFLADPDLSPGTEDPLPGPDNRPTLFGTGERKDGALSITSMLPGNGAPAVASTAARAVDRAPIRGLSVSLRFRLDAPRSVSAMVHDIHGNRIGQVAATQTRAAGTWSIPLSFSDLPAGIYLVVLSTDVGERVTQRVVVE